MLLFVTEIAGAVISRDGAGNVIGAKVLYGSYLFPVAYSDAIMLGNILGTSENWDSTGLLFLCGRSLLCSRNPEWIVFVPGLNALGSRELAVRALRLMIPGFWQWMMSIL